MPVQGHSRKCIAPLSVASPPPVNLTEAAGGRKPASQNGTRPGRARRGKPSGALKCLPDDYSGTGQNCLTTGLASLECCRDKLEGHTMTKLASALLGWLAVLVAAVSTWFGTVVVAIIVFCWLQLSWWQEFLVCIGLVVVWHWGGYFLSCLLLSASNNTGKRAEKRKADE